MSDKNHESYETIVQTIDELASKKKWSQVLASLRKLTMYSHKITIEETIKLAEYLPSVGKGNDDKKVARLIHMIISNTYFLGNTEQKQQLRSILSHEIETPFNVRYASCIKVYVSILTDLNETSSILPALQEKLNEGMNGMSGDKTGSSKDMLPELFTCLFISQLPLQTMEPYIKWGLASDNLPVIRLSLGILLNCYKSNTTLCETLFSSFVRSNGQPNSSLSFDTQSFLYYTRLCYLFSKLHNCTNESYIKGLCFALNSNESSVAVMMNVNEFISLLPFDEILKYDGSGNVSNKQELITFVFDNAYDNLLFSIEHNDQTLFMACCRILINIISNITKKFNSRSNISGSSFYEHSKERLNDVYQRLFSIINHVNLAIRCTVIKVCLWLVNPLDNGIQSEECSQLLETLKTTELPNEYVKDVFSCLHKRIEYTPELSYFSVLLSWAWLNLNPLSISINDLTTGWKLCFNNRDDNDVTLTLEHIYKVLDLAVRNVDIEQYVSVLKTSCIWFLGECSSFFKPSSSTDNNESSFDPSFYYQSILLRLQKSALIGDWATRREAIRALGKIGIKAGEPVRITVYEILKNLSEESDEGNKLSNDLIDPIIDMLDIIYTAIENKEDVTTLIKNQLLIFEQGDCNY